MKGRIVELTLTVICATVTYAQQKMAQPDVLPAQPYTKVMIIPYREDMYFSDADTQIAEASRLSVKEVRRQFRYGLTYNLGVSILAKNQIKNILYDTSLQARIDLEELYSSIYYRKAKRPKHIFTLGNNDKTDTLHKNHLKEKPGLTAGTQPIKEEKYEDNYIQAVLTNTEILRYLADHYGTGLFVFINQMDLKTHYEHCSDRWVNNFDRHVIVHYDIYNWKGNHLDGGAVEVVFTRNINDINQIIMANFPIISDYIGTRVPELDKPHPQPATTY